MIITGLWFALLSGVMPPVPVNNGLNNGLWLFMPNDHTITNIRYHWLGGQDYGTFDTGVTIGVSVMDTTRSYIVVAEGYDEGAEHIQKQKIADLGSDPIHVRVLVDLDKCCWSAVRSGRPFMVLYIEEITRFIAPARCDDYQNVCCATA